MEQTYTLTRTFDAEGTRPHTFTVTDTDAINCAHMLAAGFNTISRNMMGDFVLAVVDTKAGTVQYDGKVEQIKRAEPYEVTSRSLYEHIAPEVLESAYAEMQAVKSVVEEVGVETIPLSSGVREMQYMIENRDEQIAAFHTERLNHAEANAAVRVELIRLVSGAYTKLQRIDKDGNRADLQARFRGMLDVLAGFLVATGEADYDERHAVARRLAGVDDVDA